MKSLDSGDSIEDIQQDRTPNNEEQVEKLIKENQKLRDKNRKLKEVTKKLVNENNIAINELNNLNEQMKIFQGQIEQADLLLQEERKKVLQLSQELSTVKMSMHSLPKDTKEFNEKIEALKQKHQKEILEIMKSSDIERKITQSSSHDIQQKQSQTDKEGLKKEKIILETLAQKVAIFETENKKLSENLKAKEERLEELGDLIDQKTSIINILMSELRSKLPASQEYLERFDQGDIEFLNSIKKRNVLDIQILAEKTFLENVRLRKDIKILGDEIKRLMDCLNKKEKSDLDI